MLQNYSNISTPHLVDLLALETERFTHLLSSKQFGPEYDEVKKKLDELNSEIAHRKEVYDEKPGDLAERGNISS